MQIPKKPAREKLATEEGAAAARLSKKLVKLQTDMDLPPLRCQLRSQDIRIRGFIHRWLPRVGSTDAVQSQTQGHDGFSWTGATMTEPDCANHACMHQGANACRSPCLRVTTCMSPCTWTGLEPTAAGVQDRHRAGAEAGHPRRQGARHPAGLLGNGVRAAQPAAEEDPQTPARRCARMMPLLKRHSRQLLAADYDFAGASERHRRSAVDCTCRRPCGS